MYHDIFFQKCFIVRLLIYTDQIVLWFWNPRKDKTKK